MTVTYTVENAPPMSQRARSFELTDIFFSRSVIARSFYDVKLPISYFSQIPCLSWSLVGL